MSEIEKFQRDVQANIDGLQKDTGLARHSLEWIEKTTPHGYSYNFRWMGRPIIQFPQDMIAMQEIIWDVRPTTIIETGVAHGGSAVFYASLLELLGGEGKVVAIDIDIRQHNRRALESHPLAHRLQLIEGSSVDPEIVAKVGHSIVKGGPVLVALDSNHTQEHVLQELRLYSPFVTKGSYLVVFDTVIEDMPDTFFKDRPWKRGNTPKSAVQVFLQENRRFKTNHSIDAKLQLSVAPEGYLQCVED
jgi:cephalosporin hydroxylase